jgi:hypothetical protein
VPNIRINKKDKAEYQRLMRNAKRKMKRLAKKGIDQETLLGLVDLPPLQAFDTRKEFNRWKEEATRFTKRQVKDFQVVMNEKGVPLLGKEIKEYKAMEAKAIQLAEEHYINTTTPQERIFKKAPKLDIPDPLDLAKVESRERFKTKTKQMKKRANPTYFRERDLLFKSVFVSGIEANYQDSPLLAAVLEKLDTLSPDEFYELYKMDEFDSIFNIEFYPSDGQGDNASDARLNEMNNILNAFFESKIDMPLKNFPDKI